VATLSWHTKSWSSFPSQSPIQRGWLCGEESKLTADQRRQVSIPYPAGMALWPAYGNRDPEAPESQSPIQRGWLCGRASIPPCRPRTRRLNPLSSGDGFVAGFVLSGRDHKALVSIPYPAGMALWLPARTRCFPDVRHVSQSPIQRGWLCGGVFRMFGISESKSLNPLSSGDGFVAPTGILFLQRAKQVVSIPYPAGMALWRPRKRHAGRRARRPSQSPIQRGWLCGPSLNLSREVFLMKSQSPIQRGWLCGPHGAGSRASGGGSQSPIQRGWLCGQGRMPMPQTSPPASQSPIQRGWLCGQRAIDTCGVVRGGLNPLSSGDGFVANEQNTSRRPTHQRLNPLSSGDGFVATALQATHTQLEGLNPLSSGDGFVACRRRSGF